MKKKVISIILLLIFIFQISVAASEFENGEFKEIYEQVEQDIDENSVGYNAENVWKELYVSTDGDDSNDGSKENPVATLQAARNLVRNINKDMQGDIVVHIESGFYYVDKMLELGMEDSGSNGYNVVWLGNKDDMPVISGGKRIEGFKASEEYEGLYEVKVDYPERILNLYVNGHSRELAAGERLIYGEKKPEHMTTDAWYEKYPNATKATHEWYDSETDNPSDGIFVNKEEIGMYDNVRDVFAVYDVSYQTSTIPVEEIFENPYNSEQYIIRFGDTWNFYASKTTDPRTPKGTTPFVLKNAFELLDSPGEFYFNREKQILYYMPYADEDMETAEVIMPYQTNLINVQGKNLESRVTNIVFEGIQFSHTMYNDWTYNSFKSQYGENSDMYGGSFNWGNQIPSAIRVHFANHITFENNNFFGIGGNGIRVLGSCEYIHFIGNAFTDIGVSGVLVEGYSPHLINDDGVYTFGTPNDEQKKKPLDLLATPNWKISLSYDGMAPNTEVYGRLVLSNKVKWSDWSGRIARKTWVDEYKYPDSAWKSDPNAPARGEKSWIRYDFGGEYNINKIAMAFSTDYVSSEEKSNYEILLSNDMFFKEGSYETVAVQTEPAKTVQEYNVTETGKYRYMLIRTLDATPFAVSQVWAFTNDAEPYPQAGYSKHVYIKNNYFARIGINVNNSPAIVTNFLRWKTIVHNEVKDLGYSGIVSQGDSGANPYSDHSHSYIAYNKVVDTNKSMQDGGPIYVLGYAPYSIMEGNYIEQTNTCQFGFYTDAGSSGWHFINNAIEDHVYSYSFYTAALKNGNFGNFGRLMYATQDNTVVVHPTEVGYDDYGLPTIDNDADAVNVYVRGQPNREVYNIMKTAGIEPEYEWLRKFDKDDKDHMLDYYDYYNASSLELANFKERHEKGALDEAQNILDNGMFGNKLGEFPMRYKSELENVIKQVADTSNTDWAEKIVRLRKLSAEIKENIRRYSLADTINLCKRAQGVKTDNSAKPKMGTVSEEAMNKLNEAVNNAEKKISEGMTYREEFDALVALEEAYNSFNDSVRKAGIEDVVASDIVDVVIDEENRKAVMYFSDNIDLENIRNVNIVTNGNGKLAGIIGENTNWSKGVSVPVSCIDNNEVVIWEVKAEHIPNTESNIISANSFKCGSMEEIVTKQSKNGTFLPASHYPYISDEYSSDLNGATLKIKPYASNEKKEFSLILGIAYSEDFQINNKRGEYDRVEVKFGEKKTELYSVISGKSTLIGTVNEAIDFNTENEISYSFNKINDTDCITLKINGKTVANNALNNKVRGFYCGIYSPNMNIEVLEQK